MSGVQWLSEATRPDPFNWLGVTLPSEESASSVVRGDLAGLLPLALHFLGRSAIIGTGLFLAGARDTELLKYAAVSAGSIELALLLEAIFKTSGLPTGANATDVIQGKSGSIVPMLGFTLARSVIIGSGLALFGARGEDLVKYSLAGSAAVEAFVLSYAWLDERKKK